MHTIQETCKTPHADVYMLTNVIACCAVCDIGHATIRLTNLANYSVQWFPHSYLILNIRHNKISHNAYIHNLCENHNVWLPTSDNLSSLG